MKKLLEQVVDKLRKLRMRIQARVDKLRNLRIQDRIVLLLYSIMMVLVYIGNGWFKEKELQSTGLTLPERVLENALNLLKSNYENIIDEKILINWGVLTFILFLYWIFFGFRNKESK